MAHVGKKIALCSIGRFGLFFRLMQGLFGTLALGRVQEGNNGPAQFSLVYHWIGPHFDGKTGSICAPEKFIGGMDPLSIQQCIYKRTFFRRIGQSTRQRMVYEVVHVFSKKRFARLITHQTKESGIAERTGAS